MKKECQEKKMILGMIMIFQLIIKMLKELDKKIKINFISNSSFNNNKFKDLNRLIQQIFIHQDKIKIKFLKINFKVDI
jgi:hypothetical protein